MGDFKRDFNRKRSDRGSSDRNRPRFSRGDRGRDRRSGRPEMHSVVCDKCSKDCEVPFKPTQGKPIYCDDCFRDQRRDSGPRSERGRPNNNEDFDKINKKLDRILNLLEGPTIEKEKPKKEKKEKREKKKK